MKPTFFARSSDFRKWLEKNHEKETELLVGFYKVDTGKESMTWSQSVDEALCFGWIDGVRKSMGEQSYTIRFTPRKPGSNWSAININKMEELITKGLVRPAGMAAYEKRQEKKSRVYAYEKAPVMLSPAYQKKIKANRKAWDFFSRQAPSYQRVVNHWIMNAKQTTTQESRLKRLITASEQQKRL
jgi:uncharacterized protein YdeI (YjbR/CyaY-like superfamily)